MTKNRKKANTYRFNGNPCFHAASIYSVEVADLEALLKKFEEKLANPDDPDDKRWTARWLDRIRKEFDKKQAGQILKQRERQVRHRTKQHK